jgi:outer membrane protein
MNRIVSIRISRSILFFILVALGAQAVAQPPASAPQAPQAQPPTRRSGVLYAPADYGKPAGYFPNFAAPYMPRHVPAPIMTNTARVDQLLKDGKLLLSLDNAIALALENNLDIGIARYNLSIADTDILRTKAGATVRGVATGLVQGTPGGGVGGIGAAAGGGGAGGTSAGAGGAGSGASGIVSSTLGAGTNVDSYDPFVSSSLRIEHAAFPLSNTVTTGVSALQQNQGTANFTYGQAWSTGTSMQVTFDNNRVTTNSLFTTLVPQLNSNFQFLLRQHLAAGFGLLPNRRFIQIAKNNREISDIAFRNQVIATVSQIQNIYWDLVNAYQDMQVKNRSLALAQKTLADNREQVKLGTLAPIEVARAESDVAARNQDLILAQTQLQLEQLLIKNAISRSLSDPAMADAAVIPSDTMDVPDDEQVQPVQDLLADAFGHRPELAQARIDLTNRVISRKASANALLPQVDLVSWYGASALAGTQNPLAPASFLPPGTIPATGFGDLFSRYTNSPDYAVGFSVQIPIRNRAAQADQIRSELEYRQAEMRLQQLQNQINIEVRNAQFAVQQDHGRVVAARKARDLAQQNYEIEQKKYLLGASTNYAVLQAQRDWAQAESNLVAATTAYEKSRVQLDQVTGLTLTHLGIDIADAEKGSVEHMPNVPGVKVNTQPAIPSQEPTPQP